MRPDHAPGVAEQDETEGLRGLASGSRGYTAEECRSQPTLSPEISEVLIELVADILVCEYQRRHPGTRNDVNRDDATPQEAERRIDKDRGANHDGTAQQT
jgi:hypothetical protein